MPSSTFTLLTLPVRFSGTPPPPYLLLSYCEIFSYADYIPAHPASMPAAIFASCTPTFLRRYWARIRCYRSWRCFTACCKSAPSKQTTAVTSLPASYVSATIRPIRLPTKHAPPRGRDDRLPRVFRKTILP